MHLRSLFCLYGLLIHVCLSAQLVSGPMLGQIELRDARVWAEVSPQVKRLQLSYGRPGGPSRTLTYAGPLGQSFNPVTFVIGGLEPNTTYQYQFIADGKAAGVPGRFTTKDLWQWRRPAPDFSFIAGSCSYFNEPPYDRPGTPYGGDSSIFETMARERSAFMLWLGDNWYTREVDYYSAWGLWYRAQHDRGQPVLRNLLRAMPQLATWDDHDFGPNNSGRNYLLKKESREVFTKYWGGGPYGEGGEGIYSTYSHSDVDLFLLDARWWRSADSMRDSIGGRPNPDKVMLGARQLNWLKNALLFSSATFKLVVVGSQVLNPVSPYDKFRDFSIEYNELMRFLEDHRVNGVVFVSGDRHHSEIIRVERPGTYPLYDITVSPLTSGTHAFSGSEASNPWRVFGLDQKQNYGRFTIRGPEGARELLVEFLGVKGERLGEWRIRESELRTPAPNK